MIKQFIEKKREEMKERYFGTFSGDALESIQSFHSSSLLELSQLLAEKVKGMEMKRIGDNMWSNENRKTNNEPMKYNQALSDILALLSDKIKEI